MPFDPTPDAFASLFWVLLPPASPGLAITSPVPPVLSMLHSQIGVAIALVPRSLRGESALWI